jgi:hypothetical protein
MMKEKSVMLPTKKFAGNRYEIAAWARGQRTIYYVEFGSYQGEWLLVGRDDEKREYHVYKGDYGSCSGCDAYEARLGYGDEESLENQIAFGREYDSFIEVPAQTAANLSANGRLGQVFPANIRDDYGDMDLPEAVRDISTAVKIEEGVPIALADILETKNQEIKQRALKLFGYERFVAEAKPETVHADGDDSLIKVGDIAFLYVKDGSTPRRYLLRVPPQMRRVREAKAWTFGLRENEYAPLIET